MGNVGAQPIDGPDWLIDGLTQVQWGLNYISERYGTPQAAWTYRQTHFSHGHVIGA